MDRHQVFVLGLDDFHRPLLEELPHAAECEFRQLLAMDQIRQGDRIPIAQLVDEASAILAAHDGPIDAIVGFWDFPINCLVPILSERFGLPHKPLEGVVACEHKYWARVVQERVVPSAVPPFQAVHPFAPAPAAGIELEFPFWLKPVMSYSSYLGFHIDGPETLEAALETTRQEIGQLSEPFEYVLDLVDLPPDVAAIRGDWCIAEGIIGGRQCTLEGFVHEGRAHAYGIVDSDRVPGGSSFHAYRYPSALPEGVQERMASLACRTVEALGLDRSAWNVECFWDEGADHVWLLEVNSRLSESHADLFKKVDGVSNQAVMLDLALGRRPEMPHRAGTDAHAAKFFVRRADDAYVERVPTPEEIARIETDVPGAKVIVKARAGEWLHDLPYQDSYSFELAWIHLGAGSTAELEARYRAVAAELRFGFRDEPERTGADFIQPSAAVREVTW